MTTKADSLYWRLLQQARPYWLHLTGIFLLSFLSSPFALLAPLPLKIVVDSVLDHHPLPRFLDAWLPAALTASETGLLALAVGLLIAVALLTRQPAAGAGENLLGHGQNGGSFLRVSARASPGAENLRTAIGCGVARDQLEVA